MGFAVLKEAPIPFSLDAPQFHSFSFFHVLLVFLQVIVVLGFLFFIFFVYFTNIGIMSCRFLGTK
jgi:hypothetical protein